LKQIFKVVVTTKSYLSEHDMGWEGATKDEVKLYILNRMEVNLDPVSACANSEDEEFCESGVFLSAKNEIDGWSSSGCVELHSLVESDDPPWINGEAFKAILCYALDWTVEVSAESQEEAKRLVEQNLARCFQLEELDTAGYIEIEEIQIVSVATKKRITSPRSLQPNLAQSSAQIAPQPAKANLNSAPIAGSLLSSRISGKVGGNGVYRGWDNWVGKFKPIKNHLVVDHDENMFETYGDQVEFVVNYDPKYVWTFVSGEKSDLILAGYHFVNGLGYYITEVPWESEGDYALLSVQEECKCYKEDRYVNGEQGEQDCPECGGRGFVTTYFE
jgi:hypothetical protein